MMNNWRVERARGEAARFAASAERVEPPLRRTTTAREDSKLSADVKVSCFARGIRVAPAAQAALSDNGRLPLTLHEYATTGGVTLELPGGIFVNAPFDEWYCNTPEVVLDRRPEGEFFVTCRGSCVPVRVVPLPGYLGVRDMSGRLVTDVAMSHTDRVRLSPLAGCAYSCQFCDIAGKRYVKRPAEQLLQALNVAKTDKQLPVRHALVSGGTPSPQDFPYFIDICCEVAAQAGMPVDVMMSPQGPPSFVNRLVEAGVHGFAFNLEIFDQQIASSLAPQKARMGLDVFSGAIERAVELTGGKGRVRSLLVVGLESEEATLQGVEHLARLGCDPVLSPFRPARGTPLENRSPPTAEALLRVHGRALDIAHRYGVELGPRCLPCQHNTLTFPEEDGYGAHR